MPAIGKLDIDWGMAVMRALLIKQLSEKDIVELHEMENTRAFRYFGHYQNYKDFPECYPNWLITPYEIKKLWFNKCKGCGGISQDNIDLIVALISKKLPPPEIEQYGGHGTSIEWQHSWDWTIYHDIPVLALPKKNKNGDLADYLEDRIDQSHREIQ